ncbi:MAG: biotin--[acetyl-CoA-carboxylase] ligase [Firmicutes bacterium]|nr:biotin--[acetyl-CoA-carboxylase] ligase [Bacillota bacterium]
MRMKHFQKLESTNLTAKEMIKNEEAKHGDVIVASMQTGGRGTNGRSFFSPKGGLYMSIVLDNKRENSSGLMALAAISVCKGIEKFTNKKPMIKWVNDILIRCADIAPINVVNMDRHLSPSFKKAGGILVEMAGDKFIVGIGINFFEGEYGSELKDIACGIGQQVDKDEFLKCIASSIINNSLGDKEIFCDYKNRLLGIGQEVYVDGVKGFMQGINDEGALLLNVGDEVKTIYAGTLRVCT